MMIIFIFIDQFFMAPFLSMLKVNQISALGSLRKPGGLLRRPAAS